MVQVTFVETPRDTGNRHRVTELTLFDGTASVKLTLRDADIDKVSRTIKRHELSNQEGPTSRSVERSVGSNPTPRTKSVTPVVAVPDREKILQYAWHLKKEGYRESTIFSRVKLHESSSRREGIKFNPWMPVVLSSDGVGWWFVIITNISALRALVFVLVKSAEEGRDE